jgi:electron transfer flavoprotein beta subunit
MKIVVPIQMVPDLVEELVIDDGGTALDPYSVRWMLNEFDDHALEQAILLKERKGGLVIALAPSFSDVDDVLYTAAAKGADRLIKVGEEREEGWNNHTLARMFQQALQDLEPDLVLTGVQAHNSLDGPVGPQLAELMGYAYVGYVSGVVLENGSATVRKEYPGGLVAEMEVQLPAVLGIQSADTPPRYVPISKIRQAMKGCAIEEMPVEADSGGGPVVERLSTPEATGRATFIEGDPEEIATRVTDILKDLGVL